MKNKRSKLERKLDEVNHTMELIRTIIPAVVLVVQIIILTKIQIIYHKYMKNIKFIFEEIFKNGGSRKHSMTIDLSIQKNWEAVCNYDQFSEIRDDDKIYTDNPKKCLKIIENIDTSIFDYANEMSGFSSDTISDLTGDEPDESYYDNGPEQEKYYFEEVK